MIQVFEQPLTHPMLEEHPNKLFVIYVSISIYISLEKI